MGRTNSMAGDRAVTDSVVAVEWRMRFRDGVETVWLWNV